MLSVINFLNKDEKYLIMHGGGARIMDPGV